MKKLSLTDWKYYLNINEKYHKEPDKEKIVLFVFLWMKYNDFYNQKNPTMYKDPKKAIKLAEDVNVQNKYEELKENFVRRFREIEYLDRSTGLKMPRLHLVSQNGPDVAYNSHNNSLKDFLTVVYKIRCNFFHGEKEPNQIDIKLIGWAYDCLNELLEGIL